MNRFSGAGYLNFWWLFLERCNHLGYHWRKDLNFPSEVLFPFHTIFNVVYFNKCFGNTHSKCWLKKTWTSLVIIFFLLSIHYSMLDILTSLLLLWPPNIGLNMLFHIFACEILIHKWWKMRPKCLITTIKGTS